MRKTQRNKKLLFGGEPHDHSACIGEILASAETLCESRSVRLTPLRRRVLELVSDSHKPIGAYAILDTLRQEGRAAPPTVYRALDFLLEQGLVHRVASLNAYVCCRQPEREHSGQFLICDSCRSLAEIDAPEIGLAIDRSASEAGFEIRSRTVETFGLCPQCRK